MNPIESRLAETGDEPVTPALVVVLVWNVSPFRSSPRRHCGSGYRPCVDFDPVLSRFVETST